MEKKTRYVSFLAVQVLFSIVFQVNLNIEQLQKGIEDFIRELKRLPREVKSLSVAGTVEGKMKEFKDSIPLFADLKHEALRER